MSEEVRTAEEIEATIDKAKRSLEASGAGSKDEAICVAVLTTLYWALGYSEEEAADIVLGIVKELFDES